MIGEGAQIRRVTGQDDRFAVYTGQSHDRRHLRRPQASPARLMESGALTYEGR